MHIYNTDQAVRRRVSVDHYIGINKSPKMCTIPLPNFMLANLVGIVTQTGGVSATRNYREQKSETKLHAEG